MNKKLYINLMALVAIMTMIKAQAEDRALTPLVVTGSKESLTQISIDTAKENVKTIPGGASIVDLSQVREGRQSTWTDSLGMAPGVFIQDRFGSEEARISVRGSALSRTYHSFGIKVLQDGIPISYADGFFDMQTVDPNASSYVEVLRGPNATTYGATTLGGSINFMSPTGHENPGITVRGELGSFAYNKLFTSTAGVINDQNGGGKVWDYFLAGSQTKQDGFRDHAQMENQKLLGNVGVKLSRDIESRFYVAAVRSRTQLPGYLTKSELKSDPTIANSSTSSGVYPYRVDANRRRDVDTQRLANKTTIQDGDTTYELAFYAMNYELWHPIDTIVEQHAQTIGGHFKVTKLINDHQISFAYLPSLGSNKGTSKPSNNMGSASGAATSDYDQEAKNNSFFIEDKFKLTNQTTLLAGLQFDRAIRKVTDIKLSSNNYNYEFSQWSPRIGITHDLNTSNQFFASVSRNFEPPIFGLGSMNNSNVRSAQSGVTYEMGTRGNVHSDNNKERLEWDMTLYRANLKNEFFYHCTDPNTSSTCTTLNVPSTIHQGVELGVNGLTRGKYEARVAFLMNDFKYDGNSAYGNNKMPGVAPLLVRAETLYRWGDIKGDKGLPSIYIGPKFEWASKAPMDATNSLYNESYFLLGFKAGQQIDKDWSWFADARNLTNKKYAATTAISTNYGGSTSTAVYYPGDGRSFYVGLERRWN